LLFKPAVRTRVASPFARERGRVRVAPGEIVLPGGLKPLTLILSPLAKGRGEINSPPDP
jgi:hypothetical protein